MTSSTKQPTQGLGVTQDYLMLYLNTMLQSHKLIFIIINMNTTRQQVRSEHINEVQHQMSFSDTKCLNKMLDCLVKRPTSSQ